MHPIDDPSSSRKSVWQRTKTQNLFLYAPAGTYHARTKVEGRIMRRSLETSSYTVARERLAGMLKELRESAGAVTKDMKDIGAVILAMKRQIESDPSLAKSTRKQYLEVLSSLGAGKGAALPARLNAGEMQKWWALAAENYAPQQANHLLMMVRRLFTAAKQAGLMFGDPLAALRRVNVPRQRRNLLTADQFRSVIAHIRAQRKALSEACADWMEFAAYSGARPGEQLGVRWTDIDEAAGYIRINQGKTVSQTGITRRIPIIPPMTEFLARLRQRSECTGLIFPRTRRPRSTALKNACKKLGLPHQRPYDLRHLFATLSIQAGVDVPTVSRWLGHKDGGALAMKTYIHPDERHSLDAAKKVRFE